MLLLPASSAATTPVATVTASSTMSSERIDGCYSAPHSVNVLTTEGSETADGLETVTDRLSIRRVDAAHVEIKLTTFADHDHSCAISGIGVQQEDGSFLMTSTPEDAEQNADEDHHCPIRIARDDARIVVSASSSREPSERPPAISGARCQVVCGARGRPESSFPIPSRVDDLESCRTL